MRRFIFFGAWLGLCIAFGLGTARTSGAVGDRPPCPSGATAPADPLLPPDPSGPTPVELGFFVTELRDIDPVRGSFHFQGSFHVLWCDSRLAFDPEEAGTEERVLLGSAANAEFERIWNPRGFPVNRAGNFEVTERVLRIRHDGSLRQDLNVSVDLATRFDLRRFPFDRQNLELNVESSAWNRDQVRLVPTPSHTGFSDDFEIPEWKILQVTNHVEEVAVLRSDVPFERAVIEIEIERQSGFYLWKGILPLVVIVAISWSVFWMSDERFAGRSRISATGVLTIVAYQFVLGEGLPRVAYLTVLDKIMIISFGLLAVTTLESLLVSRQPEGSEAAHRIDRASRLLFPLVYGLLVGVVLLTSG